MKRVTGIGGIFFKSVNPKQQMEWYKKHLGLNVDMNYGTAFIHRKNENPDENGFTAWSPFAKDTNYFDPSSKEFMINYCRENLKELLKILKDEGVQILDEIENIEYGKFVHILDPEGNKIELWEPVPEVYRKMVEGFTTG